MRCAMAPTCKGRWRRATRAICAARPLGRAVAVTRAGRCRGLCRGAAPLARCRCPAARQIAIVPGRAGHKLAPQPARLLREALLLRLQAAVLPAPADLRAYVEALGKLPAPTDDPSESGPDATLTVLQHVAERAQAGTPLPEVVAAALKTAITRCERAAVRSEVTSTEPAIAIDRVLPRGDGGAAQSRWAVAAPAQ